MGFSVRLSLGVEQVNLGHPGIGEKELERSIEVAICVCFQVSVCLF